jgi:archaellin
MERIMRRTEAGKWFWLFMLVAALAAATVIGLSAFVQSKAMSGEPDFRIVIAVTAQQPQVAERTRVSIEPSRIEVVGTRSPSIVDRLAALLAHRKHASEQPISG